MSDTLLSLYRGEILDPAKILHPATRILREVASKHGLTVEEMTAPSRWRKPERISHPRQEAMWRMRQETTLSFPEIARRCGMKDHTSAMHGVRKHKDRLAARGMA